MMTPLPGITADQAGFRTRPFPGISVDVVSEADGEPIEEGQGLLVIRRPWPSMLRTLFRDDERFVETYFSRFGKETYFVGDAARRDKDGYYWVIGRIDDVVNVSGHRLSTAEVESAIVAHEAVAEAAVIGQSDEHTGQAICAFVTLQGTTEGTEAARGGDPRDRRRADRQVRPPQAHHLGGRPAEDALWQDHAQAPARHRRGARARGRHDAARPGRRRTARRGDRREPGGLRRPHTARAAGHRLMFGGVQPRPVATPCESAASSHRRRRVRSPGTAAAPRASSPQRRRRRRRATPPRRPRPCASRSRGAACAGSRSR